MIRSAPFEFSLQKFSYSDMNNSHFTTWVATMSAFRLVVAGH